MKVFQIEEPEGPPLDASGPGAAVGIAMGGGEGAVAFAVAGNAEILPAGDGARLLYDKDLSSLLAGLKSRAEKQLARPVTHAVIAVLPIDEGPLATAVRQAGVTTLEVLDRGTKSTESAALQAALLAEDLAPQAG